MISYRLVSIPAVDLDLESAFDWYENEWPDLGVEFLDEVRALYDRIGHAPLTYAELRSGIRRALTRRFPYAAYFTIDNDTIVILAVIHASRDPAEWQRRSNH